MNGDWQEWVGRSEEVREQIGAAPLTGLQALLDRKDDPPPQPGTPLPPLTHWLHFLTPAAQSELGADGHPRRGGFLPPVSLPRRMWAGGRLRFEQPLCVGDEALRRSVVRRVQGKTGRSGPMVFVTVEHTISTAPGLCVHEEQDIVYCEMPVPGAAEAPMPAPGGEQASREIVADPVLLFRYSALTLNGHRIHYDRGYAVQEERHAGLVVHGPLIATLLVDLLRRQWPGQALLTFDFKAVSPLFDAQPFTLCARREGNAAALWARNAAGGLAMQASATFAP